MILHSRTKRVIVIGGVTALVLIVAGLLLMKNRPEAAYDRSFDTSVAEPAFSDHGPLVLYDEGHRNTHTANAGYKPLADLIQNDGFRLQVHRETFTPQTFNGVSVLLVVLPTGANDAGDQPAFTDAEIAAIVDWIRSGGSMLLVSDHWPYGSASATLARALGVDMGTGLVEDPEHHHATRGASHLEFTSENGLLVDHPLLHGRTSGDQVTRVLTFTGTSMLGPSGAVPLFSLSPTAIEYPSGEARVEKKGGDTRVSMNYGEPVPATGRAQALVMELDNGRVVILGEAGMLRAQGKKDDSRVGMNVPGYDNRRLALNIMHWLSRVI